MELRICFKKNINAYKNNLIETVVIVFVYKKFNLHISFFCLL